jgi:hypothetical protein
MSASEALRKRLRATRAAAIALEATAAAGLGWAGAIAFGNIGVGIAIGAIAAAIFLSRASVLAAARRLERRDPSLDGAVLAFAEGGGGRLREPLAEWVLERRPRASHARSLLLLALAGTAVAASAWWRSLPRPVTAAAPAPASEAPALPTAIRISVEVSPPAYAHRPSVRVDDPTAPIEALKGSTAVLTLATGSSTIDVSEEGKEPRRLAARNGKAQDTLILTDSTALKIGADRVVVFRVVADRPPDVELTLPREDRTVREKPEPFEAKAEARDDVGLESLALFYTLAHGHGEGMKFRTGRIDGPKASGLTAHLSARLDPAALGFGSGDTLVIWAEATDGNAVDGPGRSASAARILRWEEDLAAIQLKSSAPTVRPMDGLLSQREILARTLRLLNEKPPREKLKERSLDLAQEQGRLRAAYAFFLHAEEGDSQELDVDEKELAESGNARARRLVAEAVSEMWSSEGELSTVSPQAAVPHQRIAVKKLDEAFGNERYALRALAPPEAPVDEGRRLKGDAKGMKPKAVAEARRERPEEARMRLLAAKLLLASENRITVTAKSLADELWALPETAGIPRATLAAPLYAVRTPEETARAQRAAAEALLNALDPKPVTRPAASPAQARLFGQLDGAEPPREPARRKEPAR